MRFLLSALFLLICVSVVGCDGASSGPVVPVGSEPAEYKASMPSPDRQAPTDFQGSPDEMKKRMSPGYPMPGQGGGESRQPQ